MTISEGIFEILDQQHCKNTEAEGICKESDNYTTGSMTKHLTLWYYQSHTGVLKRNPACRRHERRREYVSQTG